MNNKPSTQPQPIPKLDEALRLRAALQSIVRRWDDSERTGSLAWLMCEDARAALGPEVIVDRKVFDQAHGLREISENTEFMVPPSVDGPGPADCDDILGKKHYTKAIK